MLCFVIECDTITTIRNITAMTVLRIIFCILACLCAAVAVPIGIFFEWWCLIPIVAAFAFGLAMIMVKNATSAPEEKTHTDFMNTDEENEKIRNVNEKKETK